MSTETRDSSPITEEVRFIEECPHCQSSLSDWMRKARGQHILRCEKRQIEIVENWPVSDQVAWYVDRVQKIVPTAWLTRSDVGVNLVMITDDNYNTLSKSHEKPVQAWREAWARLYSAQWAEYRQKIKDQHLNRFAEKHGLEVKTPAERDEDEGNRTQAAVRGELVGMTQEEFKVSMGSYVAGIMNEATGRRSVDELGIEEKLKECPQCGSMNLGADGDCGFCDKNKPYRELPVVGKSLCSRLNEELRLKANAAKEYVLKVYPNAKVIYPTEMGNHGMGYRIQGQTKEGHLMDLSVVNDDRADSYTHDTELEAWIKAAKNVEEIGMSGEKRGPKEIKVSVPVPQPVPDEDEDDPVFIREETQRCLDNIKRGMRQGMVKEDKHPEQIPMAGGKAASSKIPPFHLIPTVGLRRLAERFALGIERKGDKAWNALSKNQEVLSDKEFLIERLGHVIDHATKLRDKVMRKGPFVIGDDDAAAIAWAGMYAICATEIMQWVSETDNTVREGHQ